MSYDNTSKIIVAPVNTNIGGDIQKATGVYNNGDIGHDRGSVRVDYRIRIELNH